jgi:hypothetical protein
MSRTIKEIITEQVKIYREVREELQEQCNFDICSVTEMDMAFQIGLTVYENVNKWLLSDKISSEKQGRMDAYNKDRSVLQAQGSSGSPDMDSPTQAQIKYATMLGINVEGKSKKEISNLIDKAKKTEPRK